MRKERSLLRRLLGWLIPLALIAALVVFVGIPLYGPQPEDTVEPPVISYYEGDSKPLTMENELLQFELDPKTTQFRLTEKKTGREWRSNPANAAQDTQAISANKALLQSTLVVTYSSANGVIDFNSHQFSVENGSYLVDQTADSIDVTYSIGRIEKIFILPTAITQERFASFTDKMSKSNSRKTKNVYTLYRPDKVAAMDNKDELLGRFPELANQPLYVLRSDVSENNKKSIASYFEEVGYTMEDYELDLQLVARAAENNSPVFNVTISYRLDGGDLLVSVPYEKIRYRSDFPITYITVLPMFGAAGVNDQGFMFVPEGGGALINFNNGKLNQNAYYANMYGWDYASGRLEVVSETKNAFPVFGMAKNGGSFICMLEGASSYGGIQADISMRNNSYNWICAKYNVLHSDQYNVSAKTSKLVYMFEQEIPADTLVQRYRFLDGDSYVQMAQAYGEYLKERYPQLKDRTVSGDLPALVELAGAIDKKVIKFGLPIDSVVPMTRFKDAEQIIGDLKQGGVKNLSARMSGWANGGLNQSVLNKIRAEGVLGGAGGMKQLTASAKQLDVPLYFDCISAFAYKSGFFKGFIPFRDAARFTTREQVVIYPYSMIDYQQQKESDPFYLVQPSFAKRGAGNMLAYLKDQKAAGVSFRDIGSLLSADYNPKNTVTREQVKQMNIETMQSAHANGQAVAIKEGFDYALPYADLVTDMDLKGTGYSIIDAEVPFYQIALHGMIDYTGKPLNLAGDWKKELLHCAEYGAGLEFTFMQEDTKLLQDTLYSGYYGASYRNWKEQALQILTDYQRAMEGLNSRRITDHRILAPGLCLTVYDNGTQVYVNYNTADGTAGQTVVPARSYLVVRGDQ